MAKQNEKAESKEEEKPKQVVVEVEYLDKSPN